MTEVTRYGAAIFVTDSTGQYLAVDYSGANNFIDAVKCVDETRKAFIEETTPKIVSVAFEIYDGVKHGEKLVNLSNFGDVPDRGQEPVKIYIAIAG